MLKKAEKVKLLVELTKIPLPVFDRRIAMTP